MKSGILPRIAVGVLALGVVGALSLYFLWDPNKKYDSAPNVGASGLSADVLTEASATRTFFGHRSVGKNILSGVADVYATSGVPQPQVIEIPIDGEMPALAGKGGLVHAAIGENGDPAGKLANFDSTLRAGVGDQVDVALLKFCYVDVRWDTDVDALFAQYRQTMNDLERDYPRVRFLHSTVPLSVGPEGIKDHLKIALGRDDNATRTRYNEMIRSTYGADRVFDLAAAEATAPDGSTLSSLYPGYSSDGAHLNASGASMAAAVLLNSVADSGQA